MKILVTGASGLLGYEFCRQLTHSGHEVWAVDNHSRSEVIPPCSNWTQADLTNPATLADLPRDFNFIYHYSAINGTKNFYERPNAVMTNNMIGDFNVFELARQQTNLQRLVYASSSEVVSGSTITPVPEQQDITIQDIHNARWSYRLPKICAENYLANSDLPWLALRYFNVYGSQSKPGHFVADQILKIQRGVFEIIGANETRSFCHVTDAVQASVYLAEHVAGIVVNVGNDAEITIADAAQIIAESLGHAQPTWTHRPGLAGSTANRRPDISKLRLLVPDYYPRDFRAGMQEVIANGAWR